MKGKISRFLVFALCLSALAGCGDTYRFFESGEVGWVLKKEIRDKRKKEVAIAKLTKFKWDELYLFSPYEGTRNVCEKLSLSQADCASSIKSESTSDGEMLMVFLHKGKVVHSEMHFRWHGDFTPVPEEPLTPRTAIFDVSVEGRGAWGGDWLKLFLKPQKKTKDSEDG